MVDSAGKGLSGQEEKKKRGQVIEGGRREKGLQDCSGQRHLLEVVGGEAEGLGASCRME
jgi:hypothetical protein